MNVKEHSWQVNDTQLCRDMTTFVTASKDNTVELFDSMHLEHQKIHWKQSMSSLPSLTTWCWGVLRKPWM